MHNPGLYAKYNDLQRQDAEEVLNKYSDKLQWKEDGDRIVDVGCGDGSVTTDVLMKYLPRNFVTLTGLDISEEVVEYAYNKHGGKDSRLQFVVHDLQKDLPAALRESFDKVFSFYVFHFVPDNENAFKNVYQLLAEGGSCLLTFLARSTVFEVYSTMARSDKWKSWLKNVDQCISPYQYLQEPVAELEKIMRYAGFKEVKVKIQRKSNIFKREYIKQLIKALNTFKLSGTLLDDYVEDFVLIGIESGLLLPVGGDEEGSAKIQHDYDLFIATASK